MAEFAKALAALPLRYSTPIRIEHPVSASYDIVVTQSGADQVIPESAGTLSGQPVHTVYLQVGAPRAWILQYCVPKEVAPAPNVVAGAVVTIGSPPPALKAPFPLVTILPPAAMLPRSGYIIVHGFVDTSGQLTDLAVIRAPEQEHQRSYPSGPRQMALPASRAQRRAGDGRDRFGDPAAAGLGYSTISLTAPSTSSTRICSRFRERNCASGISKRAEIIRSSDWRGWIRVRGISESLNF